MRRRQNAVAACRQARAAVEFECPLAGPRVLAVVATPVGMRVLVARFFRHMISENVQVFWAALQRGEFITDAAEAVGRYRKQGARWVVASGGVRPRRGPESAGALLVFC
jgi:hypothetical protein